MVKPRGESPDREESGVERRQRLHSIWKFTPGLLRDESLLPSNPAMLLFVFALRFGCTAFSCTETQEIQALTPG